jgi:hypothetical protein
MTNVPNATPTMTNNSSFGLRHSFVILSSVVIHLLVFAIRVYQLAISPALTFLFGAGSGCRFTPTCSVFALDALREHGAVAGTVLATKRLCRCHPWGGCGHDPVPEKQTAAPASDGKVLEPAHS